jgi:hypothetical protein
MPGDFVDTNYNGVFKETYKQPGGYEQGEGGRVMVPEVSGEGGFGGPGEYKKYPEIKVNEYEVDEDGIHLTDSKIMDEVSFTSSPSKQTNLGAPGKVPAKTEKAPSKKKRPRRKPASKQVIIEESPEVSNKVTTVTFRGTFGETTAPYEDVFFSGINMVLVASTNAAFSYSPPQNEEGFSVVTEDGDEYHAYSVGISFVLPGTDKKITVLLVDQDD